MRNIRCPHWKTKTFTLKSKTCFKTNKKKIEDVFIQNKPRIVNKILIIAKSAHEKISKSQFFCYNSVPKSENDKDQPQTDTESKSIANQESVRECFCDISFIESDSESTIFTPIPKQKKNSNTSYSPSHITSEPISHECNKTIRDYENVFDISLIQDVSESPNFSYKPKMIKTNKKNKFDPSAQIQKLMLLDVKPTARLEKYIKENLQPYNAYQNLRPKQNTPNKSHKVRKCQSDIPQFIICNCEQSNVENNLVMLKWISHEQNLGSYDPANFTAIASMIFSSHEIEKYLRRKKKVEDICS